MAVLAQSARPRRSSRRNRNVMARGPALAMILLTALGLLGFVALRMDWDLPADTLGAQGTRFAPPDDYLRRTAFHDGRLWILTYGGQLWSLAETDTTPRRELEGSNAVGLCADANGMDVLVSEPNGWSLLSRSGETFVPGSRAMSEDDFALTLVCGGPPLLLTDRRLIDIQGSTRPIRLQKRLQTFPDNRVTAVAGDLFFSTTYGEAGTTFYRIQTATGATGVVRDDGVDQFCGSLINGCLQVTSAVPAPWDPACLVLSQRASHMGPDGRILELCGSSARRLHTGPCFYSPTGPGCTEPFDSLLRRPNTVLAAGSNGLIEIGPQGAIRPVPTPPMRRVGPFYVGFGPDFVAVNESGLPRRDEPPSLVLVARNAPPSGV
jgi:hypothetical protein